MARAARSFPVPGSPMRSAGASVAAAVRTRANASAIAGQAPIIPPGAPGPTRPTRPPAGLLELAHPDGAPEQNEELVHVHGLLAVVERAEVDRREPRAHARCFP